MSRSLASSAVFILLLLMPSFGQERRIAISGTVTDPAGIPVPGTEVTLRHSVDLVQTATTDQEGLFRFDALDAGSYSVEVIRTGFVAVSVTVRASSRSPAPLRIKLKLARRGGAISIARLP